ETAPLAEALAGAGYRVLVSTATDIPLAVGSHPNIARRHGPLSEPEMVALVRERQITAIVDATHPYASEVQAAAQRVAASSNIPCLSYVRPGVLLEKAGSAGVPPAGEGRVNEERENRDPSLRSRPAFARTSSAGGTPALPGFIRVAGDHAEAARTACKAGKPILLTIGSKNVRPYAEAARRAGVTLVARVLSHADSVRACRDAGIADERIITGRGPFSAEENRRLIRQFGIGVLVTKDSGEAGGVSQKLEAARLEGCRVIMVGRPQQPVANVFDSITGLVNELLKQVATDVTDRVKDGLGVT
ncbi:MAG: precorrin-6A/cobalt-precorrin-6A reductase, partial [Verrucomicrobia bacterium]|nr:precorrin-6A/cobalt-precorrin-6A reductase [Verrucomicrobiota bacterium]